LGAGTSPQTRHPGLDDQAEGGLLVPVVLEDVAVESGHGEDPGGAIKVGLAVEFEREGVAEADGADLVPVPGFDGFIECDSCGYTSDLALLEVDEEPGAIEGNDYEDVASLLLR
jgi:hypothetical protein